MSGKATPIHYLRGNAAERAPQRLFLFDTESYWEDAPATRSHRLRLWVGVRIDRRYPDDITKREKWYSGASAQTLADALEGETRSGQTLWCYSHNLSFDLALTGLPLVLAERSWEIGRHALASSHPWARYSRNGRRLVLADSSSLLPTSIAKLGSGLGIEKPTLPGNGDTLTDWYARCRVDCEILARSLVSLVDWWQAERLGNWSVTGSGCGWNAYRHRFPPKRVLIDPDASGRALEREAIYGGYRWIRKRGILPRGPYVELDFRHAHLSIAAEHLMPVRRLGRFESLPVDTTWLDRPYLSIIARCRVRTERPCYPVRMAGCVWYPVGEFWTTLCGPELSDARERGNLLEIGAGYYYALDATMRDWGRWVAGLLDGETERVAYAVYQCLKGWSRTTIGRWAVRHGQTVGQWVSIVPDWRVSEGIDASDGSRVVLHHLGHKVEAVKQDVEAENGFPAVLAWVQSWARLYLNRVIDKLGAAVWQANTDGMLVNLETIRREGGGYWGPDLGNGEPYGSIAASLPDALESLVRPLVLTRKREGLTAATLSPQHILFAGERHFAGIPRNAERLEPGIYTFWTWPGLGSQLEDGSPGVYRQRGRTVDVRSIAPAGWLGTDLMVSPVRLETGRDGANQVVTPYPSFMGSTSLAQRSMQHKALQDCYPVGWESEISRPTFRGVVFGYPA